MEYGVEMIGQQIRAHQRLNIFAEMFFFHHREACVDNAMTLLNLVI